MIKPILSAVAISIAAGVPLAVAHADDYPNRPIRLVVPFPPGGGNDNVARPIAQKLGEALGQTVVVDNRPGAGTMIGAEAVAKATPDGYTLFFGSIASHAISPNLYQKVNYDPIKDFEPISLLASAPTIFVVSPKLPFKSVAELVAAAKANPGKYTYGSAGTGTPPHLSGEIFRKEAGIDILHVPYKGGNGSIPDVISGRVDMMFDTAASAMQHIKAGNLKPIAISRSTRLPDLPDVPTFAEVGFPQFNTAGWYGILAPAKTPKAIVDKLQLTLKKVMAEPEIQVRLKALGADAIGSSPQEFATYIKSELTKYHDVITEANIKE
jgi:tripartite-type tricarboxylate transporter receptor subunit TctC